MRRALFLSALMGLAIPSLTNAACALTKNTDGEYLIASYEDFLLMGKGGCTLTNTDSYRLTASFSAAPSATLENGTGMGIGPLGYLYGKLHGGGHTISDLTIHQPTVDEVGLFYNIRESGLIDSLELTNVSVQGRVRVGVFAGTNFGTLRAVLSTGTLKVECLESNPVYGGGLVAYNNGTTDTTNGLKPAVIENSSSAVNVTAIGSAASAGGIAAFNTQRGTIMSSFSTGVITSNARDGRGYAGGLAADNWGLIEKSYATGNVSATNSTYIGHNLHVGGLVGSNSPGGGNTEPYLAERGTIRQCWAAGNMEGISATTNPSENYKISIDAGGLVGFNSGTIRNSYASGSVALSGSNSKVNWFAGGLVGNNYSAFSFVNNVYALGTVSAPTVASNGPKLGTLIGSNQGKIQNAFWLESLPLRNACEVNVAPDSCLATMLTAEQFKNSATFPTFDFTQIWTQSTGMASPILIALLKPLTLYPVSVTRTYDGTSYSGHGGITSIPTVSNFTDYLIGSPIVTGSSQGAVNAGTYSIELSGYTSLRQDGFLLSYKPGSLIIEPKTLNITGLAAAGKTYDGTTNAVISGTPVMNTADIVDGDVIEVECSSTGQFLDKNAGLNKPIAQGHCTATGDDATNYKLTTQLTATITPKTIPVVADSTGKKAGTADPEFTYKLGFALYSDDALSGKLSRTAGEEVGTYEIQVGSLSGVPNYVLEFTPAPFVIEVASTSIYKLAIHSPTAIIWDSANKNLWLQGVRGNVRVYNMKGGLVKDFYVNKDGGMALNLPAGKYWVGTKTLEYTFQVN